MWDFCVCSFKFSKYTRKNLTSCSKSANKPSTSCLRTACPKLSTSLEQTCWYYQTVTRLFQQVRYSHDITILLQPCNILVISSPYQTWHHRIRPNRSLIMPSSLLQVVNSLFQTCPNNWEQAVRTQLVDSLWTDL
jgi:hypothetical protein